MTKDLINSCREGDEEERILKYVDRRISNGLSRNPQEYVPLVSSVKHYLNPEHIYCRLRDFKIPKSIAIFLARDVYRHAFETFFANGHGDSRISKLLKTLFPFNSYEKN